MTSAHSARPHLQGKHGTFLLVHFFPIFCPGFIEFTEQKTLILTYWCNSDVYFGLNDVSALQAWDGAGICPRVLLNVWLVKQKRSISQKKQVLVQFSLTLPQVKGVSGFWVISQDNCGLSGRGEGPGEGEILKTVRGDAWDGQRMTFFPCYTLWKIFAIICQKSSSLLNYIIMQPKRTSVFPRGSPHLGLVSRYERADVGIIGEITQNPQCALHSEQTLVVCWFDGWIF